MRLFERIDEMAQDPEMFVCVLVDEVESLSAARQAALGGNEPSDALRVSRITLGDFVLISSFVCSKSM